MGKRRFARNRSEIDIRIVCKIDFYKTDYRNVKENGEWVKKPYYARDELLPFGHGEKSVYIANSFFAADAGRSDGDQLAYGRFDTRCRGGDYSVGEAFAKFPLAVLLHVSDLTASYIDEKRSEH